MSSPNQAPVYLILPGSRGICREFVRQLLRTRCTIITTARHSTDALVADIKRELVPGLSAWQVLECDVEDDKSIAFFAQAVVTMGIQAIDIVVVGAGVLGYPGRISEISYADFAKHMHTNAIGPLQVAARLLKAVPRIDTLVFLSSDSGSAQRFRPEEDGFGAYAASKAALNQGVRHLAAEQQRDAKRQHKPIIMALHPGEVETDMAKIDIAWDVGPTLSAEESVRAMLPVISGKSAQLRQQERFDATFWTWEGDEYPW